MLHRFSKGVSDRLLMDEGERRRNKGAGREVHPWISSWCSGKEPTCQCRETHGIHFPSLGGEDASGVGNGNLLPYSCQEIPMDRGAWSVVHGITKKLDLTELLSTHMCHSGQPSNSGSPYMCSL